MASVEFKYTDRSHEVEKELAILLGKIAHHVHPRIVAYITDANIEYKQQFAGICPKECKVDIFFYPQSDCVFPGFRRPINREKVGTWKNNVSEGDGSILNDNTFPRHIWAFLSSNKAYSGGTKGMWSQSGLDKFELAHIFGHKLDERTLERSVFRSYDDDTLPYGLFSSASNVVLIPKGFAKPTDKMKSIKICFYKRHLDLYGNNLVGLESFNEAKLPAWYPSIEWLEPELPNDWQLKIDNLLKYRVRYLEQKYSK